MSDSVEGRTIDNTVSPRYEPNSIIVMNLVQDNDKFVRYWFGMVSHSHYVFRLF